METSTSIAATGSGLWSYTPGGGTTILGGDSAAYNVATNISPAPANRAPFRYQAWAEATDPSMFTTIAPNSSLPVYAAMSDLALDLSAMVGVGAVGQHGFAGYRFAAMLDGQVVYDLVIEVPTNFASISDITIEYESIRGFSFDTSMKTAIEAALDANAGTGIVTLANPGVIDVFPAFSVPIPTTGDHTFGSFVTSGVSLVPEPDSSSLLITLVGVALAQEIGHRM